MPLPTASFTIGAAAPITFRLLLQGADFAREADISVDHIPYGDVSVISVGGKLAPNWNGQAWFATYADMTLMRDNVGQQGLLVTGEASLIYTAVLKKVGRQRAMGGTGGHFCPVEFVLVV